MSFHANVRQQLLSLLNGKLDDESSQLNNTLRLLSKWRSTLLCNTVLQNQGTRVSEGPLKGLDFLEQSAEGCHVAKLLGTYEQPLHGAIDQAIESGYSHILNVGCAEGYYAVGMALRMPHAHVYAFDNNPHARTVCAELAKKNGVAGRVTVREEFHQSDFESYLAEKTLVVCDIEGAEGDLLDPVKAPALLGMDLIVESHDCLVSGMTERLLNRFSSTHDIKVIEDDGQRKLNAPPLWFRKLANLDQLLAVWEWRSGPTPWLVMRAKSLWKEISINRVDSLGRQVSDISSAIYFSPDGYQSSGPKLMGRHAAGAGFLRAVVTAEPAGTLTGLLSRPAHATSLADQLQSAGFQGRLRTLGFEDHAELKNPGVLYLPGPGLTDFAWRRLAAGGNAYSLCGVTHTTASHGAMESIAQLATAPLFDWDALICTSRSVRDTVRVVVEAQTDYLRWRLGASRVSLPMLPVIPLGVHCADYVFADGHRASARSRFGIDAEDVVVLFLGRLSFHAKAHPQAMYLALDRVAQEFPDRRIHLIQCGWFANVAIDQAFRQGASALCNRVTHHFLDGRDAEIRDDVWAASDIYVSLSDNIQETFGLSPLEAMAAGLPVVVTDWDGYRDTVRDGVDGFRVPTLMPATPAGIDLASRYDAGVDTYDMYCGLTCELVAVDVKATAEALSRLVGDPDLRRRMGEAGRQRVRETFDWSLILKRYRELWSEQNQRRPASADFSLRSFSRPDRLDPFFAFSDYSTWILNGMDRLYLVGTQCGNAAEYANNQLTLRRALAMNSFARAVFPEVEECMRVIDLIASNPGLTVDEVVSAFPRVRQPIIYRGLAWMMKMDVIAFPRTH